MRDPALDSPFRREVDSMNKSDLAAVVASKASISKRAASRVVDSFIDGVVMSLQKGESVM